VVHSNNLIYRRAKDDRAPGDGETKHLDWFKVAHDGYRDGKWGMDRVFESKVHEFDMPNCIPDGKYLVRFEIIGRCSP
jgi:hypothetical protein